MIDLIKGCIENISCLKCNVPGVYFEMKEVTKDQPYKWMKFLGLVLIQFLLCGCTTISVNMIRTEGNASDLIDENQSPSNATTVNPNLSIPTGVIP